MLDVIIPIVIFTPITIKFCFMLKFVVKMNLNGLNRQMMAILADEVFVFWLNFGQGTQTSTSDPNRQKNFHRQDLKKRRQRMN